MFIRPLRIDRLLTIKFGKTLGKIVRKKCGVRIPILMYHSISDAPEKVRHPYFKTNTSPRVFTEHMKILHENHYAVISLGEAADIITRNPEPATRNHPFITRNSHLASCNPVVLTFDDGYEDFYTEAFPLLQRYGFCATVFLPTGFISDKGCSFKDKSCLRWREIRELAKSRVAFGSHTVTHPQLCDLNWDQVMREIGKSREVIEDKIGEKVESFSYPFAFPTENEHLKNRLKNLMVDLSYKNGVTTSIGTVIRGDDPLFLSRIPINTDDDMAFFKAKLEGGYDWIRNLQHGFKLLKRSIK